jgi:hypothetical protein
MLYTTLNKIRKFNPYKDGWKQLLSYLNKTKADDESLDFKTILQAVGTKEAIWCLRTQEFKDYYKFFTRVAYSVLPIYEDKYPNDTRLRLGIEAVEKFMEGEISKEELEAADNNSYEASRFAYSNCVIANFAQRHWEEIVYYPSDTYEKKAYYAACSDHDAALAVYDAANSIHLFTTCTAYINIKYGFFYIDKSGYDSYQGVYDSFCKVAGTNEKKWQEIEQIFIEECLN